MNDEHCPHCGRLIIEPPPPGTPEQMVALNDTVAVPLSELRRFVSGYPPDPTRWVYTKTPPNPISETDLRVCTRLGVDRDHGLTAMDSLWGHPLSTEVTRLAPPGSNAQHRGQITRRLEKQLRAALT